jgi:hypothetical protein
MQIPIINGIYTDTGADYRTAYPVNLLPVPKQQGISAGYLRPADGITLLKQDLSGDDRGGIAWKGKHYRALGNTLYKVTESGDLSIIGAIGDDGRRVTFDYSFDYLAICSAGNVYLYSSLTFAQITDADLGTAIDLIWVDGYFMAANADSVIVTELTDPFSVNPLKYGSAEADPDEIKAILKLKNEPVVFGRNTVEFMDNVGGDLFPFARIEGAQIQRGTVGTQTCCLYAGTIAWMGSGRNEPVSVWIGVGGDSQRVSSREVDQIIQTFTEVELASCLVESRIDRGHELLYVHLPDRTFVYDIEASKILGTPAWSVLTSSMDGWSAYQGRGMVWVYDKWHVGYGKRLGVLSLESSDHFYDRVRWEFSTSIIYNDGRGAVVYEMELVGLTGRAGGIYEDKPHTIWTSYSNDGLVWSMEQPITSRLGERTKRLVWRRLGMIRHQRIQRFRGLSDSHMSFARLDATLEPLNV